MGLQKPPHDRLPNAIPVRLVDLIRGLHSSSCRGHYHLVGLDSDPPGLLYSHVDCASSHASDLGHASFGVGGMDDQRVGRISRGGRNVATGGGHAGDNPSDRCLCRVLQVSPRLHNSFNSAFDSRRRCLRTIYSDRSSTYYRPLDRIPANISDFLADSTAPSYRANYDLSDGRRGNRHHLPGSFYDPYDGISDERPRLAAYLTDRLDRPLDRLTSEIARSSAN